MDPLVPAAEKRQVYRSLICIAHCLIDRFTTVDLRNESSISGKLINVDGFMNITMDEAAFVEYEGSYKYFSRCFIPARMIRDIVIPHDVKIADEMKQFLGPRIKQPTSKKRTFKMKRAMLQQIETMRLLAERNSNEEPKA